MVFKDFQAYLCLIVVCMTILEDLLVENVWNLSIFIKALLKSHSCSLVLKIGFILKNLLKFFSKVWFSNSWFIFDNPSWSFHEPYLIRKLTLHKSYRESRTYDFSLKTCKQVPCRNTVLVLIIISSLQYSSKNNIFF